MLTGAPPTMIVPFTVAWFATTGEAEVQSVQLMAWAPATPGAPPRIPATVPTTATVTRVLRGIMRPPALKGDCAPSRTVRAAVGGEKLGRSVRARKRARA